MLGFSPNLSAGSRCLLGSSGALDYLRTTIVVSLKPTASPQGLSAWQTCYDLVNRAHQLASALWKLVCESSLSPPTNLLQTDRRLVVASMGKDLCL